MSHLLRLIVSAALAVVLSVTGGAVAFAAATPAMTASPTSVPIGATSKITATGLGDLTQVTFALDGTPGGTLFGAPNETGAPSVQREVVNGQASADFDSYAAGTFTVTVTDGETALAKVQVTVVASSPTPTPKPTPTPTPTAGPANALLELEDSTLTVGTTTRVWAKNLGAVSTVTFGVDPGDAGAFSNDGTTASRLSVEVENGEASVEFTPARAGALTLTVAADGSRLASAPLEASEATSTPASSASPTTVVPASSGTGALPWIIGIGVLLLLVAAGATAWIVLARKRAQTPSEAQHSDDTQDDGPGA